MRVLLTDRNFDSMLSPREFLFPRGQFFLKGVAFSVFLWYNAFVKIVEVILAMKKHEKIIYYGMQLLTIFLFVYSATALFVFKTKWMAFYMGGSLILFGVLGLIRYRFDKLRPPLSMDYGSDRLYPVQVRSEGDPWEQCSLFVSDDGFTLDDGDESIDFEVDDVSRDGPSLYVDSDASIIEVRFDSPRVAEHVRKLLLNEE